MNRLPSIDLLRGAVIVAMTLDHTRHFFSDALKIDATDPVESNGPLFATRWITHFCAPVFVFLAGLGAGLGRGTKTEKAKFLVIRGLWLVLLELTLVRWGYYFTTDTTVFEALVIWVLGWSMVLVAGLQFLPPAALITFGLMMILGHNALDDRHPSALWRILHAPGNIPAGRFQLNVAYTVIPWLGVMALGCGMAPLFRLERDRRRKILFIIGLVATAAFVALRYSNLYGDPKPWNKLESQGRTVMSFLNCAKYPPSFCYLLMTLGPAFLALAAFDREPGWLGRRVLVFGRVPMFFYLLHIPLLHGMAILTHIATGRDIPAWLFGRSGTEVPADYGWPLIVTYLMWAVALAMLYPLCAWFSESKRRHLGGWRSFV